jgi:hypothetical protein
MKTIQESSLSRLFSKMRKYDCGIISAFRYAPDCGKGEPYSKSDNLKRNKSLLTKLQKNYNYSITRVIGAFKENYGTDEERVVDGEVSFFVCDQNNYGKLKEDLIRLGEEFEQDSVLIIPKDDNPYYYSTNECPKGFPGEGKKGVIHKFENIKYGREAEFFSKVNDRPFFFESVETSDVTPPMGFMGRYGNMIGCNKHWKELSEDIVPTKLEDLKDAKESKN